jgi:hypothetical protein
MLRNTNRVCNAAVTAATHLSCYTAPCVYIFWSVYSNIGDYTGPKRDLVWVQFTAYLVSGYITYRLHLCAKTW